MTIENTFNMIKDWSLIQIYDHVRNHLLTQGEKSTNGTTCAYRGQGGLKCAAGCCIADEDYSPEIEGNSVWRTELGFENVLGKHKLDLLTKLQEIHDYESVSTWGSSLDKLRKSVIMSNQTGFLNDLLDDLTPKQLTELLNWMAVRSMPCNRASIKSWRRLYAYNRSIE